MTATLMHEFAKGDIDRLWFVLEDLTALPDQLTQRREELFHRAASQNRLRELHEGRAEYLKIVEEYLRIAERFQALSETVSSPATRDFETIVERIRSERDQIEQRWQTIEHLCELVIELIQPSPERLRLLATAHPVPPAWLDESDDPSRLN